jgi:hypothetical protein
MKMTPLMDGTICTAQKTTMTTVTTRKPLRHKRKEIIMRIPKNDGSGGFWQSADHKDEPAPKVKAERLVEFTWRYDQQTAYNVDNIKSGDTTKLPEREALQMQLNGQGTIGKTLLPHRHDQAAFDRFMKEEAARYHNPEFDPKPNSGPVGSPYRALHKFGRTGWLGV